MASKTLAKLIPLLLTAAVQSAPAWSAQQASGSGQVRGVVFDPQGVVFPKVAVIITQAASNLEYSMRTDNNGAYEFTNLPPGSYKVSLQAPTSPVRFKRVIILSVEVTAGNTINLESHVTESDIWSPLEETLSDAMPQPTSGDMEGLVLDDFKAGIAEVEVSLSEPVTNLEHRTRTDSAGRYRFIDLPQGKYKVHCYKARFTQNDFVVRVAVGNIAKPKTRLRVAKSYSY